MAKNAQIRKPPKLKAIRIQKGVTRKQFADEVGTSRQQILRIELGMQAPGVDLAIRIAKALGCTVEDIF